MHHKGLWNMAEICSQRLEGIKISRMPGDFERSRAVSELMRPAVATHKALHFLNVEAKVQQEVLIDFKCNNSAFRQATKT